MTRESNERYELNKQLPQMLKGGVIMDVTTPEQAKIAEEAGACAVMRKGSLTTTGRTKLFSSLFLWISAKKLDTTTRNP